LNEVIPKLVVLTFGTLAMTLCRYFSNYHTPKAAFPSHIETTSLGITSFKTVLLRSTQPFAPSDTDEKTKIYRAWQKKCAKYQHWNGVFDSSVSSVSKDLLVRPENFFIAHLASQDEVQALAKINIAYDSMKEDIMLTKTPDI